MCITLRAESQQSYTTVSNIFIDNYMPQANGEFVKIYLYLLRCMNDSSMDLSISTLADKFDQTEKDIHRALRYFAGKGLISIEYDHQDELSAITFLPVSSEIAVVPEPGSCDLSNSSSRLLIQNETPAVPSAALPEKPVYTADMLMNFQQNDELRQLLYIVEKYIGRPLSPTEQQTIFYLYDSVQLSSELIEYAVENCVTKGKKSFRYIEKVALDWSSAGITSVEDAKNYSGKFSSNVYSVMKIFGLNDRNPSPAELRFINSWYQELGYEQDIIIEACTRTMDTIHKPSFDYTDKILRNWKEQNITRLSDIAPLDLAHASKKAARGSRTSENKFNNHPHNPYDQEDLQKIFQSM